jgi:DNA helicase II / ATP-dependent DNA helicase PcrA
MGVALECQWFGEQAAEGSCDPTLGDQAVERRPRRRWRTQLGNRPVVVRDQQPLALGRPFEEAAEVLPQLGDADGVRHVQKSSRTLPSASRGSGSRELQATASFSRVASPHPPELGRGVVVTHGQETPEDWSGCQRVVVGDAEVADPGSSVDTLHAAWTERRPIVVELTADPTSLRAPERSTAPVYSLSPAFEFTRERLQHLVWANNCDARSGELVWWHGRKAARQVAAAGAHVGGPADIVLADGTPLFVDGGPFAPPAEVRGFGVVHCWNVEAGSLEPVGDGAVTADLAADQLAAVRHRRGGARVIAPAGSGKTRVLTERLRHLVTDRRVHPGLVTALAFNTKAAEQMRSRCADLLGSRGPHIRTLNSVGLWICNEYGRPVRTIDEPQVRDLLQRLFDIRRQANTDTVLPYIDALSAIRLGLAPPKRVEEVISDAVGIAEGFDRYRSVLADANVVDFDEQIYRAIEILVTDPDARAACQAQCRLLLVDEFQDLNPAHMLLIRLLSAPTYDCFGVGDDDQVIYGYSGATPEFLIDFSTYFPGAGHHALEVNYRCPPAIVKAATELLSYNRDRLQKSIRAASGSADPPISSDASSGSGSLLVLGEPGPALTGRVIQLVEAWRDDGVAWEQMVVLARVNSALLPVQVACVEAGIPCSAPLDAKVLGRTGLRTALAYLRIGLDPQHISAGDLEQTIRRPSRGVYQKVVEMLTKRAMTSSTDVRRLASRLSGRDVPKLLSYADDLDAVVEACRVSTAAAVRAIREEVGLGETMDVLDGSRREADRSTHTDDLLALEAVAVLHPDAATFEPWLRETLASRHLQRDVVLLSTIHRIKGREWDHVIVFGASNGLLPHRLSNDEEGERRVFHVAITRARRQAVILSDSEAPSAFLAELDGSRPHPPAPGARALPPTRSKARRPKTEPAVAASIGLAVERGGHRGRIVDLGDADAVMEVGAAKIRVEYGSQVTIDGQTVTLERPAPSDQAVEAGGADAALRTWRTETARREKVPAYVVMNDADLAGIASRRPVSLADLARCRGMGPIRLERYGDEILAVLAAPSVESD